MRRSPRDSNTFIFNSWGWEPPDKTTMTSQHRGTVTALNTSSGASGWVSEKHTDVQQGARDASRHLPVGLRQEGGRDSVTGPAGTHLPPWRLGGEKRLLQAGGRAGSACGRGRHTLLMSPRLACTGPVLPRVWVGPETSLPIQVSARGALDRHGAGGAGGKLPPCSGGSLFCLRGVYTDLGDLQASQLSVAQPTTAVGWVQTRHSRPFAWLISCHRGSLPSLRAIFCAGINVLSPFSTWQAPTHPPKPISNSTSSVKPSLPTPWE